MPGFPCPLSVLLASKFDVIGRVAGFVHLLIVGLQPGEAASSAPTRSSVRWRQRCGSLLNLNIHFHIPNTIVPGVVYTTILYLPDDEAEGSAMAHEFAAYVSDP